MAYRTRRGLLPAVLALASVMPVRAEATDTRRGNAAPATQPGTAAPATQPGTAAPATQPGTAAAETRPGIAAPEAQPLPGAGASQRGVAAVYDARRFTGRPMANGRPFHPDLPVAAHRHLPLGTRAEVTNLRTGARTTVVISDRGPFTRGRIIDLSPHSARQIGMNGGLAQVEVRPIVTAER